MEYADMIKCAITEKGLSLAQVCLRLAKKDIWLDRAVLSKIQNGKLPPAKDHVNIAIAQIIGVDATKLRLAAAREIIDPELYELIRLVG